jgi:hypothetical protein
MGVRDEPYVAGQQPPIQVYLIGAEAEREVRDRDGEVVTGFGFYAWQQQGNPAVDVHVFLLVPAEGQPNRFMGGPEAGSVRSRLRPKDFITFTMKTGETRELEEMKQLGLAGHRALALDRCPVGPISERPDDRQREIGLRGASVSSASSEGLRHPCSPARPVRRSRETRQRETRADGSPISRAGSVRSGRTSIQRQSSLRPLLPFLGQAGPRAQRLDTALDVFGELPLVLQRPAGPG